MNFITRAILAGVFLFAQASFADDDPQIDEGAAAYDKMNCVHNATEECIDNACLTSDEIDCEDNCRTMAQDKCQAAVNE